MAMYVVVPEGEDLPEWLQSLLLIDAAIGFLIGGYFYYVHGGSVLVAAGVAGGLVFRVFFRLGKAIEGTVPNSKVIFGVGWFVSWVIGIGFGIGAATGGFFGAGAVWVVLDVWNGVMHAT
jgi:hypothetical protein